MRWKAMSKTVPCDEFIRRKKKVGKAEKEKRGKKEKRKENGHWLESKERGRRGPIRFSTRPFTSFPMHLFIFIFWDDPSSLSLASYHARSLVPSICDSTSSPITNCPNERIYSNKAW
jgi:hypothetical protein